MSTEAAQSSQAVPSPHNTWQASPRKPIPKQESPYKPRTSLPFKHQPTLASSSFSLATASRTPQRAPTLLLGETEAGDTTQPICKPSKLAVEPVLQLPSLEHWAALIVTPCISQHHCPLSQGQEQLQHQAANI